MSKNNFKPATESQPADPSTPRNNWTLGGSNPAPTKTFDYPYKTGEDGYNPQRSFPDSPRGDMDDAQWGKETFESRPDDYRENGLDPIRGIFGDIQEVPWSDQDFYGRHYPDDAKLSRTQGPNDVQGAKKIANRAKPEDHARKVPGTGDNQGDIWGLKRQ